MAKRYWSKLPIEILNDSKMGVLSDGEWKKKILSIIYHPDNIRCDRDHDTWLKVRNKRRKQVFARDKHECRNCGSEENLEIDHIYPLSRGGSNELSNLQILCKTCNLKKRDKLP